MTDMGTYSRIICNGASGNIPACSLSAAGAHFRVNDVEVNVGTIVVHRSTYLGIPVGNVANVSATLLCDTTRQPHC